MKTNKLSVLDVSMFSSFLFKSYTTIGLLNLIINLSGSDSIFSLVLGSIMGFVPLFIFFLINDTKKSKNIFQKIDCSFPKIISPLLNIILIISVFLISSYSLYNISLFINYNLLNEIDILPIMILLLFSCIYLSSRGIKTIIRVSVLVLGIAIFITFINIVTLSPYSNPINLYPLLSNKIPDIYIASLYYMILTITPVFLLLIIPKEEIVNKKKYKKYIIISYIVSNFYSLINVILVLSILGIKLSAILNYPEVVILQKVSLLNFIERIEDILSFKMLFDLIFVLVLGIFYIKEGLINTFKFNGFKKKYVFDLIIGGLILVVSNVLKWNNVYLLIIILSVIFFIHILLMLFIRQD